MTGDAVAPAPGRPWRGGWRQGLCYGALGLPLAFAALPLYVLLPAHYAAEFGIPLATLGALLLAARLFDAAVDPWIGRWIDRRFGDARSRLLAVAGVAAAALASGFWALFFPPSRGPAALLAWCAASLALTCVAYSVLGVLHQSWGARLGGDPAQRARIVAWREGLALVGVLVASVLPSLAGMAPTASALALALVVGCVMLRWAPQPGAGAAGAVPPLAVAPLRTPAFRRLLAVFVVNGVASAVPATLVLFFIRDRLQAQSFEPLFLTIYFVSAALALPVWVRLVPRWGLVRAWLAGMALAVACFCWAGLLGPGDVVAYAIVCAASGAALGADLALPGALLAGVVQQAGHGGRAEGSYFGWWNFAAKLNLALAAGLSLPLLQVFGYGVGDRSDGAVRALTVAYCVLPCLLKLAAAWLLWTNARRLGDG